MAQRAMSWSVNLMAKAPVADVVAAAVMAEELGYDRCWVFDEGLMTRDVFVTLTAIAGATSRIGIGSASAPGSQTHTFGIRARPLPLLRRSMR
ncbi:MAG: LLM class flavin-dependent oxidoreductase [Actinobacteria bacterium]|nr:LLM class flavin-dependent oxidoreductase [Actinomycetota bacterium]